MSRALQFLLLFVALPAAQAACLDPKDPTLTRYYTPSVEEETIAAAAIVVAKVVKVLGRSEDPADQAGFTSYLYTLQVSESLKGRAGRVLVLKISNDSGSYRMSGGETHLLFLRRSGDEFSVDSCGNSSEITKGRAIAERVKSVLATRPPASPAPSKKPGKTL